MTRLTLSQVLKPCADVINQNVNSQKILAYINRAQEELLDMGRWVGTTVKYRVCTSGHFVTWPRELSTIEAMKINGSPTLLQNQWYEFDEYGADNRHHYNRGDWAWGMKVAPFQGVAVDQGNAISFADVCGSANPKKLKVYAYATEATTARILLQFYDAQGNYVRSNDPTEGWVDGEFVSINATTPQTTINPVTAWVGVQKPITNGVVRITELDTVTNLERLLAVYAPDETNPSYRRSRILDQACNPNCVSTVTVIGKQTFIPALKPRDYLCISSMPALVNKVKACYLSDNNNAAGAAAYDQKSFSILDTQLGAWIGSATPVIPHFNLAYAAQSGPSNII